MRPLNPRHVHIILSVNVGTCPIRSAVYIDSGTVGRGEAGAVFKLIRIIFWDLTITASASGVQLPREFNLYIVIRDISAVHWEAWLTIYKYFQTILLQRNCKRGHIAPSLALADIWCIWEFLKSAGSKIILGLKDCWSKKWFNVIGF